MTRDETITGLKEYFKIYELVGEETYNKYKDDAWQFFSTDILKVLYILRKGIGQPFYINNWYWGGDKDERGLRDNLQEIFKKKFDNGTLYLSGHVLGMAFDFTVKGMTADQVRTWIKENANLLPCKVRLEHKKLSTGQTITWVHIDVKHLKRNPKVYLFNV